MGSRPTCFPVADNGGRLHSGGSKLSSFSSNCLGCAAFGDIEGPSFMGGSLFWRGATLLACHFSILFPRNTSATRVPAQQLVGTTLGSLAIDIALRRHFDLLICRLWSHGFHESVSDTDVSAIPNRSRCANFASLRCHWITMEYIRQLFVLTSLGFSFWSWERVGRAKKDLIFVFGI